MRQQRVIIVGGGFGGIATAIELQRYGFTELTILEKADGFGGTWRSNTYPGAACDVPSHLYSYSYAQRRDWTRLCSPQSEILQYVEGVAREHGLDRRLITGVTVTACQWDDDARTWTVGADDGRSWVAEALVIATGQLHQPHLPEIPGLDAYEGHSFHSAQWDHEYSLEGKRVAVIGTGASAVQFVPAIVDEVGHLSVFQRTGNWFLPRRNRAYPRLYRALIEHLQGFQTVRRRFIYQYTNFLTIMIRHPRTLGHVGHLWSRLFMRRQLSDPDLRRRAWPDYTFGCKRILFSSAYLPALGHRNTELVTERIERMDETGILTADGRHHPIDCVIYGTGFKTTEFMFPMEIIGAGGRSLRDAWAEGAHAHLGITVPGFPSLFLVYGPNTNTSGGSIIVFEESQARYIRLALAHVRANDASAIDVRADVEAALDRETQARFDGTAWTACDSWYRDERGRIVTNWPGYMREYELATATLDPDDFELLPSTTDPAAPLRLTAR